MKRRAVCVGINDYPGTGADLSGCANDAFDWGEFLARRGYEVITLLDANATKGNVLAALEDMLAVTGYRDRFVFQFSGHGSKVPDRNGDEADGFDEVLITHDYQSGGWITDDELGDLFGRRSFGARGAFIADTCHSGSVNRFVDTSDMDVPDGARVKFMPPTRLREGKDFTATCHRLAAAGAPTRAFTFPHKAAIPLLAACADDEYAYDAWFGAGGTERPNGAFTRFALDTFPTHPGGTWREWHASLRVELPSTRYDQTPQLAADSRQRRWTALD